MRTGGKARPGRDADQSPHLMMSGMSMSYKSSQPRRLHGGSRTALLYQWINIISIDQKLVCSIQFQSLLSLLVPKKLVRIKKLTLLVCDLECETCEQKSKHEVHQYTLTLAYVQLWLPIWKQSVLLSCAHRYKCFTFHVREIILYAHA
jgi:hypothetical protein